MKELRELITNTTLMIAYALLRMLACLKSIDFVIRKYRTCQRVDNHVNLCLANPHSSILHNI
jgi:hypothetical protein